MRRAYTIATTPPYGPTFVAIPVDYWNQEIEYTAWTPTILAQVRVDPADERIEEIARAVERAEFPLLVVGYEAIMAGVSEDLMALASRYSCPIVAEPDPAMLPAPVQFELFGGTLVEAAELVERADVILHVGANTYEAVHGRVLHAGGSKRHFWLGSSGRELNKIALAEIAVIGPVGPSVAALAAACQKSGEGLADPRLRQRAAEVREQIAADRRHLDESREEAWDAQPMSVARICAELRTALPPETVLVEHATTATLLVRENFPLPTSRHYVCASASCQGWGLGAAVGVSFALGAAPVVAIIGDGGFLFGMQAIWTAVQYDRESGDAGRIDIGPRATPPAPEGPCSVGRRVPAGAEVVALALRRLLSDSMYRIGASGTCQEKCILLKGMTLHDGMRSWSRATRR
jgi:thiamine pyrophosphate-dependent acetolactate synthase large subunit-like protein